jgi:hypothetical protein
MARAMTEGEKAQRTRTLALPQTRGLTSRGTAGTGSSVPLFGTGESACPPAPNPNFSLLSFPHPYLETLPYTANRPGQAGITPCSIKYK